MKLRKNMRNSHGRRPRHTSEVNWHKIHLPVCLFPKKMQALLRPRVRSNLGQICISCQNLPIEIRAGGLRPLVCLRRQANLRPKMASQEDMRRNALRTEFYSASAPQFWNAPYAHRIFSCLLIGPISDNLNQQHFGLSHP